ncbi:MAG TPA: copper-binding protein, partial [Nitrosopumilaceae archaeon]|nr:copper-binding protein [Nitrosopumilaceae archaeon]
MRSHLMVFALTAILVASVIATPAFAQSPILVSTDMPSYNDGDTIMVSGTVSDLLSGYQISIQIFEPEFGNI